jgi:hypothetical protein
MATETFVQNAKSGKWEIPKAPNAQLDYWQSWDAWLNAVGDTIIGHTIILTPGNPQSDCQVVQSMIAGANKKIVVWIKGGIPGEKVAVTFRIFTNSSPQRIDDRTCYLKIKSR